MVGTAVLRKARVTREFLTDAWQRAKLSRSRGGRPCPYCQTPMNVVSVPIAGAFLSLDICQGCSCIWFDPGEYEQAPKDDQGSSEPKRQSQTHQHAGQAKEQRPPATSARKATSLESLLDSLMTPSTKAAQDKTEHVSRSAGAPPPREPSLKKIDLGPVNPKPMIPAREHTPEQRVVAVAKDEANRPASSHQISLAPAKPRPKRSEPPRRQEHSPFAYQRPAADKSDDHDVVEHLIGLLGFPVEKKDEPVKTHPWVTWGTAAILVLIVFFGGEYASMAQTWGFVPAYWYRGLLLTIPASFFIHASFMHMAGNVYFLMTFGDDVEDHLGPKRYVWLIALAHVAGLAAHAAADMASTTPCVGASAGISGIIAFYAIAFPRARLSFLLIFKWVELTARKAFAWWVGLQLLLALLQSGGMTSVSGYAHLGGALVGLLGGLFLQKGRADALGGDYRRGIDVGDHRRGVELGTVRRGAQELKRWSPPEVRVKIPESGYLRTEQQVRAVWQNYKRRT
jgi:membrane associated rhomboid family serine protease/Zn-finger nucleic acid-binding protein